MKKDLRIISLLPSATETIYALGLGGYLVGRSHDCNYPEPAKELPVCSSPRFSYTGSSQVINKAVKDVLKDAVSIYNIDLEKIRELSPTHIITQSQCKVCAVSTSEIEKLLGDYVKEQNLKFIDLNPQNLDHALADFVKIAAALSEFDKGFRLRIAINNAVLKINMKANMLGRKPSVAFVEWIDPLMVAGNWMYELIDLAAARNIFPSGEQKQKITVSELLDRDPEKIILSPCGFNIQITLKEYEALKKNEKWNRLQAVKNKEVYVVDGSAYFNRPGPRLLDSLEILTEIVHPDDFERRHDQNSWMRLK